MAIAIALTLALGTGATTTVLAVVDAVWFQSVPYPSASRLLALFNRTDQFAYKNASWPEVDKWRAHTDLFYGIAAYSAYTGHELPLGHGRAGTVVNIEPAIMTVLGETVLAGRPLTPADAAVAPRPVLLSESVWRSRFGADPAVIGRVIDAPGDLPRTIVGVLPARFSAVIPGDAYEALVDGAGEGRGNWTLTVIARIRPDVTLRDVQSRLANLPGAGPDGQWTTWAEALRDRLTGKEVTRSLFAIAAAAWVLMLIACANVTCLMLTRLAGRTEELRVRLALGATRRRIARLLLAESAVFVVAGGLAALVLLYLGRGALIALMPPGVPRAQTVGVGFRPALFCALCITLSILLVSILPVLRTARLTGASGVVLANVARVTRPLRVISAVQVALSLATLILTSLLLLSAYRLATVNPGFAAHGVAILETALRARSPATALDHLRPQLLAVPGVTDAAAVDASPFSGKVSGFRIKRDDSEETFNVTLRRTSPDYFETMQIPMRRGRQFQRFDTANSPQVAIVNETAARVIWPGERAIGRTLRIGTTRLEVVGIVADVRSRALDHSADALIYRPIAQQPGSFLDIVVRTRSEDLQLTLSSVRRALSRVPDVDVIGDRVNLLQDRIEQSTLMSRFRAVLFASLAVLACLLTLFGVVALTTQTVASRTREMGVRLALGAQQRQIVAILVRDSVLPGLAGTVAGLLLAWWAARLIEQFLFQTSVHQLAGYAPATAWMVGAITVSSWLAARGTQGVDPVRMLRDP